MSALIFVALAVAWAVYLVPKALKHHDEVARSRTVEGFSHRMRVLARREVVDKKTARLVTPAQATAAPRTRMEPGVEPTVEARPAPPTADRRAAARRATKRRRNVLAVLLVANLAVIAVAAFSVVAWPYVAIPAGLLVAWLVTCRLMVKSERKVLAPTSRMPADPPVEDKPVEAPAPTVAQTDDQTFDESDEIDPMVDTSAGIAAIVDPAMWDPVPVTLPTYVTKPTATRRTVRTIDLDSTGVWTSGRTDADSQLAREADEADKAARKSRRDGDDQQAVGS